MAKTTLGLKIRLNREKRAADLACDILEAAGLMSAPVNPVAVASLEYPRLVMKSGDFKDAFDGRLEYHVASDRFILFFNTKYDSTNNDHHPRTRFSISHELGHYYLDDHRGFLMRGGGAHSSTSEFVADDIVEREADAFAAGLLMPSKLFCPIVNEKEPTIQRIKSIADDFQTSWVSTAIRSVSVSDFPCEIVGLREARVAWRFPSPALIEGGCYPLSKGAIPSSTAREQREKFSQGEFTEGEFSAQPSHWFRSYGPAEKTFTVTEQYLPVPTMGTLLVLLTVPESDLVNFSDKDME